MLRTHWTPSPCTRLSRARTTTGPPPHFAGINRRQIFPATMAGTSEVVPTFTLNPSTGSVPSYAPATSPRLRRSSSPWPPGRRHQPAEEFPARPSRSGARCNPAPICQVRAGGLLLRGFLPLVPRVHLSVSLAGPAPSDSAGASRRCQGCFRLHRCPPGQAALSFSRPAATGRWWWSLTTARFKSASWRSMSQIQVRFGPVATSSGLAYCGWES